MLDMHLTAHGPRRAETMVNGVTMKTTVLAVLALAAFATAQQVPDPKAELATVIAVEEQEGDLAKAEGLYRQVLAGTALSAPARAFATLRLGMLLKKLGRDAEAKPFLDEAKKSSSVVVALDDVTGEQQLAREKELREQARAIVKNTLAQTSCSFNEPLPGFGKPEDATRLIWIGAPAVPEVIAALQEMRGTQLSRYSSWAVAGLAGFLWSTGDDASAAFLASCADGGTVEFRKAIVQNAGLSRSQRMLDVAAKFLRDPDPRGDVVIEMLRARFNLDSRLDPDLVADAGSAGPLDVLLEVLHWARTMRQIGREPLARLHHRVAVLLEGTDPEVGMKLQAFLGTPTSQRSCEGVCMLLDELPKMVQPRFDVMPPQYDFGFTAEERAMLRTKIDACLAAMTALGRSGDMLHVFMRAATKDDGAEAAVALVRWIRAGVPDLITRLGDMASVPSELCDDLIAAADADNRSSRDAWYATAIRKTGNQKAAAWLLARWKVWKDRNGGSRYEHELIELGRTCFDEPVRVALREYVAATQSAAALAALFAMGDAPALDLAVGMPDTPNGGSSWLAPILEELDGHKVAYSDAQIHDLLKRLDDGKHNGVLSYQQFRLPLVPDRHVLALARLGRWLDVLCGRLEDEGVDASRKAAIRAFCHEALRGVDPTAKSEILANLPEAEFADFRADVERLLDDTEDYVAKAAARFAYYSGQLTQREWRHRLLTNRHALVRSVAFQNTDVTHCTREDLPDLVQCLRDSDEDIRRCAAMVLGNNLWVEAVPGLLEQLSDQDIVVRKTATESLERIRFYNDQQAHWDRVLKGLDATPASAAEKLLLQARPDQPKDQRLLALTSLGVLGVPEALPFLIDWTRDTDPAIQQAAKDAITQIHLHPRR